jgi:hypothetical protein
VDGWVHAVLSIRRSSVYCNLTGVKTHLLIVSDDSDLHALRVEVENGVCDVIQPADVHPCSQSVHNLTIQVPIRAK